MPTPAKGESRENFVSRYMRTRWEEGNHDQKQNAAIAYSIWRQKHNKTASNVKTNLIALHNVASSFEKEGNASAGKILTEAMRKIAQYDNLTHLPTPRRQSAEYLQGLNSEIVDQPWDVDTTEAKMQGLDSVGEPEEDFAKTQFLTTIEGDEYVGALIGPEGAMADMIEQMSAAVAHLQDWPEHNPQTIQNLNDSIQVMMNVAQYWARAADEVKNPPAPRSFDVLPGNAAAGQSAPSGRLRSV